MICHVTLSLYQVIWVLDNEIIRWLALAIGISLSGSVLIRSLWKPLQNERVQVKTYLTTVHNKSCFLLIQVAMVILVILSAIHAGLGVGFKVQF